MDVVEQAQRREELDRRLALEAQGRYRAYRPQPDGACHHCGELVNFPRLFCAAECAEQWERRR